MSKLSKDKQQKLMVVAGVTAAVGVGLWFGMISPLRGSLQKLKTRQADAQNQVQQGQRSLASALQVSNELALALEDLKTRESAMASGDLYDWMIQSMNKFKADRPVDIPQISRETTGELGLFPKYPYKAATFTLRGTAFFDDFGKFLADLENTFPYLLVQNLQLAPSGSQNPQEAERLQFSMDMVTLVKPVTP
jgi:hypothetical protein